MSDNKTVRNMKAQMRNIMKGGRPLDHLTEYSKDPEDAIPEGTKIKVVTGGFPIPLKSGKSGYYYGGERGWAASPPVCKFGDDTFDKPHYFIQLEQYALPYLISIDYFYEFNWR